MRVAKVHFRAFKSLYDVECDLDRFTVITGANGAGKSNFVDALNFLGEVYADGLEFAIGRAGGYDNIAHRRTQRARRSISVRIEAVSGPEDFTRLFSYPTRNRSKRRRVPKGLEVHYLHEFVFGAAGQSVLSEYKIESEVLQMSEAAGGPLVRVTRNSEGVVEVESYLDQAERASVYSDIIDPFGDKDFADFLARRKISSTRLLTERLMYSDFVGMMQGGIAGTKVFQLSPFQCRASGVPTPNARLERHGENLPGAANYLMRNDAPGWAKVQSAMRSILPGLSSIDITYTEDRRLVLQPHFVTLFW